MITLALLPSVPGPPKTENLTAEYPATLSSIEIKEYSGLIVTVYLDDIGLS